MKRIWLLVLLLPLIGGFSYGIFQDKNAVILQLITFGLNQNHYQPQEINDKFSESVHSEFIERLDYNKRYLYAKDVQTLAKFKQEIDDEISAGKYTFFDMADSLVSLRISEVENIYKEVLSKPFNFKKKESVEFDGEKLKYVNTSKERYERWRKSLKYETLGKLARQLKIQNDAKKQKNKDVKQLPYDTLEKQARKKVLDNYDKWFGRMKKINKEDRRELYLNTITGMYDPHTSYMPPKRKEDYDIGMSGRLEGIGATLQQSDAYIKVVKIQPGSPSWKQGELKNGDLILKVAQGDAEPVDVVDMRLDEAVRLIRGKKGTEVRLTVKKVDGLIKVISIIRDVVNIEETFAKSSVIEDKGKKYGYIYLPKFYADFHNKGGRTCAEDVEKELMKLQEDEVDGIILDLRNNGGGSLHDVVKMTGLFIETGPVVQVKSRSRVPTVLRDKDSNIQWEGALVVMVNEMSASASEILAAAIQDYKRGVVIGSSSTFGKGTVQRFVNFDDVINPSMSSLKPMGAMKLTTQKFYRINGETTQFKGVKSDVFLPGTYTYIPTGEKEHDHALSWDVIQPVQYKVWQPAGYDHATVLKKANDRIKASEAFATIEKGARYLKERRDDTQASLDLKTYMKEEEKQEKMSKKFDVTKNFKSKFTISIPSVDVPNLTDTVQLKARKKWNEDLDKDPYLNQAIMVLHDMN